MIIDKVNYRQRPNGKWEVNYMVVDGVNRVRKFRGGFKTKSKATDFIKSLESQLIHGHVKLDERGDVINGTSVAIDEFIETYMENASMHKRERSQIQERFDLENFRKFLPGKDIGKITTYDIEQFIAAQIRAKRSPHTTSREITAIKRMFSHAVKWGIISKSPATAVKKLKLPEGTVQYFSVEEQSKLLKACKEISTPKSDKRSLADSCFLYPLVALALRTGMRRGELFHLRWKHVDFERGQILVISDAESTGWHTKSGRSRIVPLDEQASEALMWWQNYFVDEINRCKKRSSDMTIHAQLRAKAKLRLKTFECCAPKPEGLVFPSFRSFDQNTGLPLPLDNINQSFKKALLLAFGEETTRKRNGVNIVELPERYNVGLHALRHSFAVTCAINNVPLAVCQKYWVMPI